MLSAEEWWVIGGRNSSGWLASTELCSQDGCENFVELPTTSSYHTAVKIDSNRYKKNKYEFMFFPA